MLEVDGDGDLIPCQAQTEPLPMPIMDKYKRVRQHDFCPFHLFFLNLDNFFEMVRIDHYECEISGKYYETVARGLRHRIDYGVVEAWEVG